MKMIGMIAVLKENPEFSRNTILWYQIIALQFSPLVLKSICLIIFSIYNELPTVFSYIFTVFIYLQFSLLHSGSRGSEQ